MKPRSNYHRLRAMFQVAMSLAAGRAYGCGPCGGPSTSTVALVPDGNGPDAGDAGAGADELDCKRLCGSDVAECKLRPQKVGDTTLVECTMVQSCGAGRRHEAHRREAFAAHDPVGAFFAEGESLERASAPAFRALYSDLEAHGAPRSLLVRTRRAIEDEKRHTMTMRRLARARGARPLGARRSRFPRAARPLLTIAIENAIEGCARETFGALVATVQAAQAEAPEIARAFAAIARDETRHAALAHDVHDWLLTKLDAADRARVERSYARTLAALVDAPFVTPPERERRLLGLPTTSEARALAIAMSAGLRT